ncbi:MAG: serine hydrolase [Anaerolineales bacterium]|nr:serine hydrolase [Anaerolineales bacterium]
MIPKRIALFCLLVLINGIVAFIPSGVFAGVPRWQSTSNQFSKPVDEVIIDLQQYIPEYMQEQGIPGVSIALIREGEVVWAEGFGIANSLTHKPVTAETLFEVASNSKVLTAYIALRLVDQGLLSLDQPLNSYLPEPWLPPSNYRDAITLRQVLSHSSGLGHNTLGRDIRFVPGSGYSYSAIGFLYTQAVLEQTTGKSLESLGQEYVFEPLGMSSSSFTNLPALGARTANGHLRTILPIALFAILFTLSLLLVGLVGLVTLRIRTGFWRPSQRMVIGAITLASILTSLLFLILFEIIGLPQYGWLIALCGIIMVLTLLIAFFAGRSLIIRLLPERIGLQRALTTIWIVLILFGLVMLILNVSNVPVPNSAPVEVSAAGTVRTTASDLARFLIELSNPQYLSLDLSNQLRTAQVRLRSDLSWGLGPGIQHSSNGDALWQWGQAPDYQSVMIIYPETGEGVVVLTNSDMLNPDVAINIAHRALGGKIEPLRQATHLEFNYDGPFLDE